MEKREKVLRFLSLCRLEDYKEILTIESCNVRTVIEAFYNEHIYAYELLGLFDGEKWDNIRHVAINGKLQYKLLISHPDDEKSHLYMMKQGTLNDYYKFIKD